MKKIILIAIAFTMALTSFAQGQRRQFTPESMAERSAGEIKRVSNVTDDQYSKLYDLFLASGKKMMTERDSIQAAGGDFRQSFSREKMQQRQDAQKAAIKNILTDEQYAAYEKYLEERRQNRNRQGFGNRQGGPRGGQGGARPGQQ